MAVISVPRELREKLGDAGSESLVDLLRQVGGEQREDLIVVVEERFARRVMEARDELRSEMHTGFLDLQQQIGGVRAELPEQIGGLRAEFHKEIGGLRAEFHKEIGGVRAELHKEIGAVHEKIGDVHKEIGDVRKEITVQTRWLGTVIVAAMVLVPVMQKVLAALFP